MDIEDVKSRSFKGFLEDDEAIRLYELAKEANRLGPCLEIGSYCGKSSAYLGMGCKENGAVLFSIDHHRGSEEQQPGQEYFDPELLDKETGLIDTFGIFRKTINDLLLENTVVMIVSKSEVVARSWATPLGMVFIDGGHTFEAVFTDYNSWTPHLIPGGFLAIHDIFSDPAQGGQAPYCVYNLALSSGLFQELPMVNTLGILKKVAGGDITETARKRWRELG
ncbi:MAG: class I SAM-dependent methyltransferase [Deltaproteobacteria bacterium]|nr:MAG: class I SAM-dependent methyltransferase [Deltaproteobacteria bacterium]